MKLLKLNCDSSAHPSSTTNHNTNTKTKPDRNPKCTTHNCMHALNKQQVSNNTHVHFACMQSMHDIAKHQNMSHLYVITNSYNVTHAQYQQRGGIMLLRRTADLVMVLMKFAIMSRFSFAIYHIKNGLSICTGYRTVNTVPYFCGVYGYCSYGTVNMLKSNC